MGTMAWSMDGWLDGCGMTKQRGLSERRRLRVSVFFPSRLRMCYQNVLALRCRSAWQRTVFLPG